MRRTLFVTLGLLVPLLAWANPVFIDPGSLLAFGIVAFAAFVVETGLVALLLLFRGLAPLRLFGAFFLVNFAVFAGFFQPLLRHEGLPLPVLEADAAGLEPYGLGAADATELEQEIADYAGVIQAPSTAIAGRKALTAALRPRFRQASGLLRGLDKLVLRFRRTEAGRAFADAWEAARVVRDLGAGPGEEPAPNPPPQPQP